MTATLLSVGVGYSATAPTESQAFIRRTSFAGDGTKTGVLYGHPAGGSATTSFVNTGPVGGSFPYGYPSVPLLFKHLAECGWPCLAADLGGDTVGNDTGIARSAEAKTYLQSTLGAKAGKFIYVGWSEGGIDALTYARANPGNIAAMVLIEPASDLNDIVTNNRGGFAALVNTAYPGGAYNDARDGPNHSPVQFAAQLAGIPTLVYYASDDPVVIPSTVQTVVAGIGSSCTVGQVLTGGHGEAALQKIDPQQVARWLYGLGL